MESRLTARRAGSTSSSSHRKAGRPAASPAKPGGLRPKKALGQHFLRDRNIIARIVDAAELRPGEEVLEIGAGPGDLTAALAAAGMKVTAVEVDRGLAGALRERFAGAPNVRVIEMDALAFDAAAHYGDGGRFALVANLPYNVGTAIVRRLLESEPRPWRAVVMLQKEVAQAMAAAPGALSLVGIGVQVFATARKLFDVAPGAFLPPPKVTSTVIRLEARPVPLVPAAERGRFFEVARAGFSAPRKQLHNALANGLRIGADAAEEAVRRAGLDPTLRPQRLGVEDWLKLSRSVDG